MVWTDRYAGEINGLNNMELSEKQREYLMKKYPWASEKNYERLAKYLKISLWK